MSVVKNNTIDIDEKHFLSGWILIKLNQATKALLSLNLIKKDSNLYLEEKHKKLHSYGNDVTKALFDEEYEKAEKYCKEAEEYSKNLIADFEKMKEIAKSKSSKY